MTARAAALFCLAVPVLRSSNRGRTRGILEIFYQAVNTSLSDLVKSLRTEVLSAKSGLATTGRTRVWLAMLGNDGRPSEQKFGSVAKHVAWLCMLEIC
jgi:hypothetical protein